jgi:hypothetical protein
MGGPIRRWTGNTIVYGGRTITLKLPVLIPIKHMFKTQGRLLVLYKLGARALRLPQLLFRFVLQASKSKIALLLQVMPAATRHSLHLKSYYKLPVHTLIDLLPKSL